ncbi:hypothetical protein HN011_004576 [Eciton burchellii]|nr:hypothetical protein HN011_004576 [Eciton burchellii]
MARCLGRFVDDTRLPIWRSQRTNSTALPENTQLTKFHMKVEPDLTEECFCEILFMSTRRDLVRYMIRLSMRRRTESRHSALRMFLNTSEQRLEYNQELKHAYADFMKSYDVLSQMKIVEDVDINSIQVYYLSH